MLDKLPLPKIEEWQIKLGVVGIQVIAIAVLLAYMFSSPIDKDEKKRAKTAVMKNAVAEKQAQKDSLNKFQYHYKNSPMFDIPISRAMGLVVRDRANASLVPQVGAAHDQPTRPVGVVPAAADLPPLELGKWVWNNKGCRTCHTIDVNAQRLAGPTWVGLYGSMRTFKGGGQLKADEKYITESIKEPRAKLVAGYPPAMPVIKLKDKELAGVIVFIKSLSDEK